MPKVIANIKDRILAEAEMQIRRHGYAATTVRSIAAGCGIAVGTVYNYFPSKEMLIASFVARDWYKSMETYQKIPPKNLRDALHGLYDLLCAFSEEHAALFTDSDAKKTFAAVFAARHLQLREQIAALLFPFCRTNENPSFFASFLAEALLTWSTAGTPFDTLYSVLGRLTDTPRKK